MKLLLILTLALLAACGGGEDFDTGPAVADTGVPRVDCAKTPQACI